MAEKELEMTIIIPEETPQILVDSLRCFAFNHPRGRK